MPAPEPFAQQVAACMPKPEAALESHGFRVLFLQRQHADAQLLLGSQHVEGRLLHHLHVSYHVVADPAECVIIKATAYPPSNLNRAASLLITARSLCLR